MILWDHSCDVYGVALNTLLHWYHEGISVLLASILSETLTIALKIKHSSILADYSTTSTTDEGQVLLLSLSLPYLLFVSNSLKKI